MRRSLPRLAVLAVLAWFVLGTVEAFLDCPSSDLKPYESIRPRESLATEQYPDQSTADADLVAFEAPNGESMLLVAAPHRKSGGTVWLYPRCDTLGVQMRTIRAFRERNDRRTHDAVAVRDMVTESPLLDQHLQFTVELVFADREVIIGHQTIDLKCSLMQDQEILNFRDVHMQLQDLPGTRDVLRLLGEGLLDMPSIVLLGAKADGVLTTVLKAAYDAALKGFEGPQTVLAVTTPQRPFCLSTNLTRNGCRQNIHQDNGVVSIVSFARDAGIEAAVESYENLGRLEHTDAVVVLLSDSESLNLWLSHSHTAAALERCQVVFLIIRSCVHDCHVLDLVSKAADTLVRTGNWTQTGAWRSAGWIGLVELRPRRSGLCKTVDAVSAALSAHSLLKAQRLKRVVSPDSLFLMLRVGVDRGGRDSVGVEVNRVGGLEPGETVLFYVGDTLRRQFDVNSEGCVGRYVVFFLLDASDVAIGNETAVLVAIVMGETVVDVRTGLVPASGTSLAPPPTFKALDCSCGLERNQPPHRDYAETVNKLVYNIEDTRRPSPLDDFGRLAPCGLDGCGGSAKDIYATCWFQGGWTGHSLMTAYTCTALSIIFGWPVLAHWSWYGPYNCFHHVNMFGITTGLPKYDSSSDYLFYHVDAPTYKAWHGVTWDQLNRVRVEAESAVQSATVRGQRVLVRWPDFARIFPGQVKEWESQGLVKAGTWDRLRGELRSRFIQRAGMPHGAVWGGGHTLLLLRRKVLSIFVHVRRGHHVGGGQLSMVWEYERGLIRSMESALGDVPRRYTIISEQTADSDVKDYVGNPDVRAIPEMPELRGRQVEVVIRPCLYCQGLVYDYVAADVMVMPPYCGMMSHASAAITRGLVVMPPRRITETGENQMVGVDHEITDLPDSIIRAQFDKNTTGLPGFVDAAEFRRKLELTLSTRTPQGTAWFEQDTSVFTGEKGAIHS